MDTYELERMEAAVRKLTERDSGATYELLKKKLVAARDDSGRKWTSAWRPAIEDHEQNSPYLNQNLHFLVKSTREALLALVDRDPVSGKAEVSTLLGSDEAILKRLALHVLTVRPELIGQIHSPIVSEATLCDHELFHEMMLLLNQRFDLLPQEQKEAVHHAIREGPPPREGETEGDRQSRIESWRRLLLGVLPPKQLTAEERVWRDNLQLGPDVSDRQFFLIYTTWSWHAEDEESPDLRAARQEGIDKLLEELRNNPRSWVGVRQLVQEDPQGMLDLAAKLESQDFHHIPPYLDAYSDLMKGGVAFSWTPLVNLCARISVEHSDVDGTHIAEVSRLLRNGLGSKPDKLGIPDDLLERAFEISVRLLDSHYTRLDVGLEDARDTSIHQLNSAPGEAADAFMSYIWRRAAGLKQGDQIPPNAAEWIAKALAEGWGGMELRHAIGQFMNVLEWLQPGWVQVNLPRLFPEGDSPEAFNARKALVNGYLLCRPTSRLLPILVPMFKEVIPDAGGGKLLYIDEYMALNPLIEQIVVGWIWDLEGFGFEGLLGQLIGEAKEETRAHIVWFLGAEYAGADEEWRKKLWPKMDDYWRWRVASLQSLSAKEPSEELTRFCAWTKDVVLPLEQMESRLEFSIHHLSMGYGIHVLLESFAARAPSEPAPVSRLLELMVNTWADTPEMRWSSSALESVIDVLCKNAGGNEKERVKVVVDRLLAAGGPDFGKKLEDCGKARIE